ncbi:DUF317 domain-containing protein [Streptomyces scopuliridis]|uniref:DUF317 domain-containing protein n=1 Tax=Streptomyces scopuliridis TaxID=452529 RepID=A0ACD4ZWY8_9ACTN|nr:DUF317 domain-containing protein [Streptomyces scopuliridis]WSC01552.1 DUF317 domain-containing protein [Streptomyces scopuliridis]WSC04910.1 DUF317 domain-containing protein [Streptomyces scopuliridis]
MLVQPAYLAGSGDFENLTELMRQGHGWKDTPASHRERPQLTRSDGNICLTLDAGRLPWKWTLSRHHTDGRSWTAVLDEMMPVEFVTAAVTSLARPARRHPRTAAFDSLDTAGWQRGDQPTGTRTATSPDGLVHVTQETANSTGPLWRADCTVGTFTWWRASFGEHTPATVIDAFAAALADPEPLLRWVIGTPLYNCDQYTRITPTALGPDDERALLDAQITRAQKARAHPSAVHRPDGPSGPVGLPALPPPPGAASRQR